MNFVLYFKDADFFIVDLVCDGYFGDNILQIGCYDCFFTPNFIESAVPCATSHAQYNEEKILLL